jgi:hypothetical protein
LNTKLALFLLSAGLASAASDHVYTLLPSPAGTPGGAKVGSIVMFDLSGNHIDIKPPTSLGANFTLTMPKPTGSPGCWLMDASHQRSGVVRA